MPDLGSTYITSEPQSKEKATSWSRCSANCSRDGVKRSGIRILGTNETQTCAAVLRKSLRGVLMVRGRKRTSLAEVDDLPAEQDHHAVEQAEAEGRRAVDGGADGDARRLRAEQVLDHPHDLRSERSTVTFVSSDSLRRKDWQQWGPKSRRNRGNNKDTCLNVESTSSSAVKS